MGVVLVPLTVLDSRDVGIGAACVDDFIFGFYRSFLVIFGRLLFIFQKFKQICVLRSLYLSTFSFFELRLRLLWWGQCSGKVA